MRASLFNDHLTQLEKDDVYSFGVFVLTVATTRMLSHGLASFLVPLCLVVALMVVSCVEGEDDLYHVLGVSHSASSREIRSAYKRLAKKWYV